MVPPSAPTEALPPLPPPEARKLIEKAARDVARLVSKRTKLTRAIGATEEQLRIARKFLRDVIHDAVPPLVTA